MLTCGETDRLERTAPSLNLDPMPVNSRPPAGEELLYHDKPATSVGSQQEFPPFRSPGDWLD